MWFNQRKWWFQPTKLVCFGNQLIAKLPSFDQLSQCHGCLWRCLFSIFPWMIYNHLGSSSKTLIIYCEANRRLPPQKRWSSGTKMAPIQQPWLRIGQSRGLHQNRSLVPREKVTAVMGKDGKGVEFPRNLVANLIMSYPYHPSVVLYTLCSICAGLSLYDVQDPLRATFHGMSVGDFSGYVCSFMFFPFLWRRHLGTSRKKKQLSP